MNNHTLESQLERLLRYGTLACSVIIAVGILLDGLNVSSHPVDLVTVGIIGFIVLPVVRIVAMLRHYASVNDIPMMRVVAIVLSLVVVGFILGMIW